MPGMYFSINFDQNELKIDECFDDGQPYLMSAVRIQYAVSYTHLDVYKRQPLRRTFWTLRASADSARLRTQSVVSLDGSLTAC